MKKFLAFTILFSIMLNTIVSASARITDIEGRPSEQMIRLAYERGMVHIFSDNTVRPATAMTRGDFAFAMEQWIVSSNVLLRDFNTSFMSRNVTFNDINSSQYFYNQVISLANRGVIHDTDRQFRPDANITREEAARWIHNLFGMMRNYDRRNVHFQNMSVTEFLDEFSDGSAVSTSARNAMAFILDRRLMQPDRSGFIRPRNSITREEGFALLLNVEAYMQSYRGWGGGSGNWNQGGNWGWGGPQMNPWGMHNHWQWQNPQAAIQPPMWTGQNWQQPNINAALEFPTDGWSPWQRPPGWWNQPPWWPGSWSDSANWGWSHGPNQHGWGWNEPNWEYWEPFWPWMNR